MNDDAFRPEIYDLSDEPWSVIRLRILEETQEKVAKSPKTNSTVKAMVIGLNISSGVQLCWVFLRRNEQVTCIIMF